MKISFHSYANTINFHMKSFALSLAFILRFKQLGNGLLGFVDGVSCTAFSQAFTAGASVHGQFGLTETKDRERGLATRQKYDHSDESN